MDTKLILKQLNIAAAENLATHKSVNNSSKNAVGDLRYDIENLTEDRRLKTTYSRLGINFNTFINQVAMANLTTANALIKIIELLEKKEKKK